LSGGVLAALAGPNLARWTRDMLAEPFASSFLALVGVALLAAMLATGLRLLSDLPIGGGSDIFDDTKEFHTDFTDDAVDAFRPHPQTLA
jgi:hypothetical protein